MFGIPVHLHWTFGLIFLYAFWIGYANNMDIIGTIWLTGFFMALFGCVLLHEYGHSLTARRYGVQTQDIILTPIGGIARLERMPEKPSQEFLVAIAGPMVNVVIAIILFALGWLIYSGDNWLLFKWFLEQQIPFLSAESDDAMGETGVGPGGLLFYLPLLVVTNIALVVFNLIPAFPMDGGRIFRALLAMRLGRVRATRFAALFGQAIAVLFVIVGLWQGAFTLTLIGLFVFTTARAENAMVQLDDVLQRHVVREVLRPQFTRLSVNDWMQTPIHLLQQGLERHFIVFDLQDMPAGVLNEQAIVQAMHKRDLSGEVGSYMRPGLYMISADDSMHYAYYALKQHGQGILGVLENGQLTGVIDEAGLQNFLRLQGARG
jgi:Zn-dependent protease/predicted transcriptional regulator